MLPLPPRVLKSKKGHFCGQGIKFYRKMPKYGNWFFGQCYTKIALLYTPLTLIQLRGIACGAPSSRSIHAFILALGTYEIWRKIFQTKCFFQTYYIITILVIYMGHRLFGTTHNVMAYSFIFKALFSILASTFTVHGSFGSIVCMYVCMYVLSWSFCC